MEKSATARQKIEAKIKVLEYQVLLWKSLLKIRLFDSSLTLESLRDSYLGKKG